MNKIWSSPSLKNALSAYKHEYWLFDGRKLAWGPCAVDREEVRVLVDLDAGKAPAGKESNNKFHVTIRQTTEIRIGALQAYLDQKIQFNNAVQEVLNFLDHLIRQGPSERMVAIKRSFYKSAATDRGIPLERDVIEVRKGVYASLRLSQNLSKGGSGMALNADISNTCFWVGNQRASELACHFLSTCGREWRDLSPATLSAELNPLKTIKGFEMSPAFKHLRKLHKLRFTISHPNRPKSDKSYTIQGFVFNQKYGTEGGNARAVMFDHDGKQTTVADYYRNKYNVSLRFTGLPLIDAGKAGYIPMEFAVIEPMQRYPFKLNPDQTASMIKIAVTRPQQRRSDIEKQVRELQLSTDPYLRHYGVEFDSQFSQTEGRILPPPSVKFGQGQADTKHSGRWDLRGKKFWRRNFAPLSNWAFLVMDDSVNLPQLQEFSRTFKSTFMGHGGNCTADPLLLNPPGNVKRNPAQCVAWAHNEVTSKRGYPQLIFVVVQHRNSPHYLRMKKSADCRFGVLTQFVNAAAVGKNNGQYHSNVCLKVNAKLGGATSRTQPPWKTSGATYFPMERPTMIIGVDVSHAAPGAASPSTAAMTMGVDRDATRFAAMVETNGFRTEMLTPSNVHSMFGELASLWRGEHNNQLPKHIIYFRDGVAEGQFAQVMEHEIAQLKSFLRDKAPKGELPKFTVIVATKRHHIRFFPQNGDRNQNPLPGTLVEKEVTHPFMWDFYLSSHVAIQGTARPVHYHVIFDEMNMPVNDLQKMIYYQCYSYARSTTPVSLHPAIYYAHLASNRAKAHEDFNISEGPRAGGKGHELAREREAKGQSIGSAAGEDIPKLLRLGGRPEGPPVDGEMRQRNFIRGTMWYI